ncbi:MAG: GNAT family N-acetyltransferase [Aphanocapsa sp. GSE-SYN-MK-11-07L]|jgi:GNAT superfamily N-acetyltransferase|nr:GNAT family N-acetyltransferase [Aphanocapsa sp. GSE-SYN-MK-11-07L]
MTLSGKENRPLIANVNPRNPITIRKAQNQDAERIAVLCQQLDYQASPQAVLTRLQHMQQDEQHVIYVADLGSERVVGWVHAHVCDSVVMPPQALLLGLVVDQKYRGSGIGRRLMQQVEQWASERKCDAVLVRSNVKRQEAHSFYQKIGYANTKQSKVFSKVLSQKI